MRVLQSSFDKRSNKTHLQIDAAEFTEWYWIAGELSAVEALAWLEPVIAQRLAEFASGEVDTPHEIEMQNGGLF